MTKKSWEQLSISDMVEELRSDMLKIYGAFNALAQDVSADHRRLNEYQTKLNEAAKAVECLERRALEKA